MANTANKKHLKNVLLKRLLVTLAMASLLGTGCSMTEEAQKAEPEQKDEGRTVGDTGSPVRAEDVWPVVEVAAEVEPSVVQVNVEAIQTTPLGPQEARGIGSGVIYRQDGYIITNSHVVEGASEVNVAFADGTTERAKVVGTDPFTEIAVVKVERGNLPAAEFGDSQDLVAGQLAVAIGSPSGFESTVTSGVISGIGREVPAQFTGGQQASALVDLIQTDAAISPGSSGGALANRDAHIVGINVAYLPPGQTGAVNIGFAIPSATATDVADQIIESGEAVHPYLGVSVVNLTPEIARRFGVSVESGAIITSVDPNGPAAEAGIEPGGVITAVDSEKITNSGDLLAALRRYEPGDSVEITVAEEDEAREFTVELGKRG